MADIVDIMLKRHLRDRTSYHEAGHAVVGLALGAKVRGLWINEEVVGCCELEPVEHFHPETAWEYAFPPGVAPWRVHSRSTARWRRLLREALDFAVAGRVAGCLHDQWELCGCWVSPAELRKWDDGLDWGDERLLSDDVAAGQQTLDRKEDLWLATQCCLGIWTSKVTSARIRGRESEEPTLSVEHHVDEIRRAERRVEKLLKRHWQVVEDIAHKLVRCKSGRLTRGQLLKLVGPRLHLPAAS